MLSAAALPAALHRQQKSKYCSKRQACAELAKTPPTGTPASKYFAPRYALALHLALYACQLAELAGVPDPEAGARYRALMQGEDRARLGDLRSRWG